MMHQARIQAIKDELHLAKEMFDQEHTVNKRRSIDADNAEAMQAWRRFLTSIAPLSAQLAALEGEQWL